MKLFYRKTGEGKPLIILHGLFGMSDNWMMPAKQFSEKGFACYVVDQRNHGKSPHHDEFNYEAMADDLLDLMNDEHLVSASLLGHSMGGKTAMYFAVRQPEKTEKLVIIDITPRYYTPHHDTVIAALHALELNSISSRKVAEQQLRLSLQDEGTVQFLLKNLYWKEASAVEKRGTPNDETQKNLAWRFNLSTIEKNIEAVGAALPFDTRFNKPTLFVRGEKSGYVTVYDEPLIKKHFPLAQLKTIRRAGHWVHAENPIGFMEVVLEYLNAQNQN